MKSPVNVNLGLTWQHQRGFFAGAGWTWRPTVNKRSDFLGQYTNGAGDRMDVVGRIGYHPGVRVYAPPPPPPPTTTAATAAGAEPSADGARALRAVHGLRRQDVHGLGRCTGSGRRPAHLYLERAGRHR